MISQRIFSKKKEAKKVIRYMREVLYRYGVVTVADFHDLCDIRSGYTDNKYGWVGLRRVEIVRDVVFGVTEWRIKLPDPMLLE